MAQAAFVQLATLVTVMAIGLEASFAKAEAISVNSADYSCQQLQQMLATNGTLNINYSLGGFATHVSSENYCTVNQWANPA